MAYSVNWCTPQLTWIRRGWISTALCRRGKSLNKGFSLTVATSGGLVNRAPQLTRLFPNMVSEVVTGSRWHKDLLGKNGCDFLLSVLRNWGKRWATSFRIYQTKVITCNFEHYIAKPQCVRQYLSYVGLSFLLCIKGHPCTVTEALYRPYALQGE